MRGAMYLGIGQVVTTVLTILLSATLARALTPADFGLLYLAISIASFAYVIVEWGAGNLIIRETARHPEESGVMLGSSLAMRTIGALVACLCVVAATWLLGYDMRTRLLIGALILGWMPQYLGLSFGWTFRAHERMERDATLNVVLKLATLLGSMACFALGGRLLGLFFTWSLAGCLTLAVAIAMYRQLRLPAITATMAMVRTQLRDGASLVAMSLAVAFGPLLNANILYKIASPEVVGWFGAASNIMGTLVAPASILGMTMYPRLSKATDNPVEFARIFANSFRLLLLLAVLGGVGTYLFADVPVALIYSMQKFGPSVVILRAFAPAVMLLYVNMLLGSVILAAGNAGRFAGAKVASLILTTVLTFILVPVFQARFGNGGLGVAYATASGELLMVVFSFIFIRKTADRSAVGDTCRTLIAGAGTLLLFELLPAFTPFLAIPACVVVFGVLSLLFGALKRSDLDMLLPNRAKSKSSPPR